MKNLMFFLLFTFLGNTLHAQINSDAELKKEEIERQIGLNVSNFFLRFVSLNGDENSTPSILIFFKKGTKSKKSRYGFGGAASWNKNNNRNFASSIRLNLSYGKEYHRSVSKKWNFYHGWDILLNGNYLSQKSGNSDKDYIRSASTGFQYLAGIQFNWKSRISFLTETSYGLILKFEEDEVSNENYTINTFYVPPISIILNYHF